jgi:hypothetical protein
MGSEAGDAKQRWVQGHTERLLQRWVGRPSPFSIAPEYARQIERDMVRFYEQPLMKAFIESTE